MAVTPISLPPAATNPRPRAASTAGAALGAGVATMYLSVIVLLPLAAVVWQARGGGWHAFWAAITYPTAESALELTVAISAIVVVINAFFGTIIAWVLVRDSFPGRRLVDSIIDLPFALPTVVAGITLLALYGPQSPLHVDIAYRRPAIVLALMFVTLPFVVRAVQPVVLELDREMEEAASSLGAGGFTRARKIVLPQLLPAILTGSALSFAKAVGEFGSVVLLSGNIPNKTEVASTHIYAQIESNDYAGAAAVSIALLTITLLVLMSINLFERMGRKHDR